MAATPPLQILSSPATPPTPLHGSRYDRSSLLPTRRSTRLNSRSATRDQQTTPDHSRRSPGIDPTINTHNTPRHKTAAGLHSPEGTPQTRTSRRVQVMSPPSPNIHSHSPRAKKLPPTNSRLQPQSSSTTTISDGMLPTPVKTPRKKSVAKATTTARALFQDPANMVVNPAPLGPSPRRSRKNKRYNGFSLESFSAEDDTDRGQIEIYTDSRDRVPTLDTSKANPFIDPKTNRESSSSQKVAGTSKRRKVSGETKMDRQVEEAISKDEGMVYVFRGKKVYRRFVDDGDEEEVIDAEDLGLLEHVTNGTTEVRPFKTLSRRSIKPKLLFQTETQERKSEQEKEEEAATDVEEQANDGADGPSSAFVATCRSEPSRLLRSKKHARSVSDESGVEDQGSRKSQKGSPFDSWPRLKSGSQSAGSAQKGKKRATTEVTGQDVQV